MSIIDILAKTYDLEVERLIGRGYKLTSKSGRKMFVTDAFLIPQDAIPEHVEIDLYTNEEILIPETPPRTDKDVQSQLEASIRRLLNA